MGFPIQKTVSAGTRVRVQRISGSGNAPKAYTLTASTAGVIGDTHLSLTASEEVFIQHDDILLFGTQKVRVNIPDTAGLADGITIDTTATSVPILPLTAAVTLNATAQTYAMRELLGITDASPPMQISTVDASDMRSGFGMANVVVGVDRSVSVNGQRVVGDRAMYEIIMPYLTDDTRIRELLYAEAYLSNGDYLAGPCRITNTGAQNQIRNLLTYSLTLTFQGSDTFRYTAGDAALFATP